MPTGQPRDCRGMERRMVRPRLRLSRLVALRVVQKPLGILLPRVVDVSRPAVQSNTAVGVLFNQATGVIDDRAVRPPDADVLAIGQAHFRSVIHCAKLAQDGKDRTGFEQSRADMSYWDL